MSKMSQLPSPRGPVSELLVEALVGRPGKLPPQKPAPVGDPLADEDLNLALYLCYELHYRGLPGVEDRWEWDPSLLGLRAWLEEQFEKALEGAVPLTDEDVTADQIDVVLREIAAQEGASLSSYIRGRATLDQVREFLVHRSAYQLKEADPHCWAIPRLHGVPKAAMVEIEADEYGGGRADWIHAELFARSMRALGLDATYGAYLDLIPAVTLATVNQMSLFGLHRRWRGAIVGHLALFEMTSSIPNRRYADGLRRRGFSSSPSASRRLAAPRTISGPSRYGVTRTVRGAAIARDDLRRVRAARGSAGVRSFGARAAACRRPGRRAYPREAPRGPRWS